MILDTVTVTYVTYFPFFLLVDDKYLACEKEKKWQVSCVFLFAGESTELYKCLLSLYVTLVRDVGSVDKNKLT